MTDDLLTVGEVVALLDASPTTVYRLAERGELDAVRVRRVWRFPRSGVEAYLERSGVPWRPPWWAGP